MRNLDANSERDGGGPWIVAIGACGDEGLHNIRALLHAFGPDFPAIVMVVLHRAFERPSLLHEVLRAAARRPVYVADDQERLEVGHCYIGEPASHLTLLEHSVGRSRQAPSRPDGRLSSSDRWRPTRAGAASASCSPARRTQALPKKRARSARRTKTGRWRRSVPRGTATHRRSAPTSLQAVRGRISAQACWRICSAMAVCASSACLASSTHAFMSCATSFMPSWPA